MNLVGINEFRTAARANRKPDGGVFRVSVAEVRALEDGSRKMRFCFSDGSVDRMGDTIDPDGWDIDHFLLNPVALWAHDSLAPPIGRASDVGPEGDRLMGTIEFVDAETYAFGDTVYRLLMGKYLRAVSVGFLPIEYSFVENDPKRGWGIDFKRQELLEISVCPVPANANALAEARAKGIDTRPLAEWAERVMDDADQTVVSKAELSRLRKAAKEIPMARRPGTRRRAEDDPKPDDDDDKHVATCGRKAADECGLKNPSECAIHGKAEDDPDDDKRREPDDDDADEKRLRRLLVKLGVLPARRADDDKPSGDDDQPPLAQHDALRIGHKCLRTAKAFHTEAMGHFAKGMSMLDDVVDALSGDSDDDNDDGDGGKPAEDDPEEKARQQRRVAELRAKIKTAA
jgi:HK97 family phage prohead protease